jgi:hypothetical protein
MSAHKTIYLRSFIKAEIVNDIAQIIEGYSGEVEFANGIIFGHYIGQIAKKINPETGEVIEWLEGFHANLLVPVEFDESVFKTIVIPPPNNPVHKFA